MTNERAAPTATTAARTTPTTTTRRKPTLNSQYSVCARLSNVKPFDARAVSSAGRHLVLPSLCALRRFHRQMNVWLNVKLLFMRVCMVAVNVWPYILKKATRSFRLDVCRAYFFCSVFFIKLPSIRGSLRFGAADSSILVFNAFEMIVLAEHDFFVAFLFARETMAVRKYMCRPVFTGNEVGTIFETLGVNKSGVHREIDRNFWPFFRFIGTWKIVGPLKFSSFPPNPSQKLNPNQKMNGPNPFLLLNASKRKSQLFWPFTTKIRHHYGTQICQIYSTWNAIYR